MNTFNLKIEYISYRSKQKREMHLFVLQMEERTVILKSEMKVT